MEMAAVVCGGLDAVRERHFLDLGGGSISPLQLPADGHEDVVARRAPRLEHHSSAAWPCRGARRRRAMRPAS